MHILAGTHVLSPAVVDHAWASSRKAQRSPAREVTRQLAVNRGLGITTGWVARVQPEGDDVPTLGFVMHRPYPA